MSDRKVLIILGAIAFGIALVIVYGLYWYIRAVVTQGTFFPT